MISSGPNAARRVPPHQPFGITVLGETGPGRFSLPGMNVPAPHQFEGQNRSPLLGLENISPKRVDTIGSVQHHQRMQHVLIADDDVNVREILASLFRSRGFSVDLVTNGLDAVREYASRDYDLVMTDFSMPELNGLEVVDAIRNLNPEARVVLMTGDPLTNPFIEQIEESGLEQVIQKPFRISEVLEIEKLLETVSVRH